MRKLMSAASPSEAVALVGINAGVAQTNVQTADTRDDHRSSPTGGKLRILAATLIALATMLTISKKVHAEAPATEPQIAQPIPQYVIPSESIVRLVSKNENGMARLVITRPNGIWIMLRIKRDKFSFVAGRGGAPARKLRPRTSNFENSHDAKQRSPKLIELLNEE